MNKRVIYQTGDGIAVIVPAPECGLSIEEIAAKDVPTGVPYTIVDASDIPADRTFRDAWEKAEATVVESLPKCKAIAHDKRRAARAAEFAPLDIEATIPSKAAQAESARQVIRDKYDAMQTAIDAAATPEGIKAVMP